MKNIKNKVQRGIFAFTALLLSAATFAPLTVHANGQATFRSVTMSSSTASASGTTYTVSFKPTGATSIGGIIVDFCADTPLVGTNACTLPTGFTLGTSGTIGSDVVTSGAGTGWAGGAGIQGGAAASNYQTVKFTNTTPQTTSASTAIVLTLSGITNPSTNGTFYARIITFDTSANATAYGTSEGSTTTRPTTITGQIDYGGAAMSTALAISLTARVMETLSFCVYGSTCGDGLTSLQLGQGTPAALDVTRVDTAPVKFSLSTNATNGAIVNLFGDTLKSGSNSIAAVGAVGAIGNGSGKFGLQIGSITTGSGTLAATTNYAGTGSNYGFVVANTNAAGGDTIANTSSAPVTTGVATITYAASPAASTAAGIYTATHQLIATGTF